MNRRSDIKRFWKVLLLILVADVAIVGLVEKWDRLFPSREVSELYSRYADVPGIDVSFVKGYRINDTLAVDVTLLQATDSAGWETLKKDFNVHELDEHTQRKIDCGINIVTMRLAPRKDPTLPMDTTDRLNNNAVAVSRLHHTVSVFQTNTMEEQHEILYYQLKTGLPKK